MSQANSLERLMLDLINEERTSRGLNPLQLELRLNDASEDYSQDMLDQDFFSHTGLDGSDPGDRMQDAGFTFSGNWTWGENISWQSERGAPGLEDDVANLHQGLMNSDGHRANILNPNFEVIGIGIERGDYNGWDAVMVTQNFARTGAPLQIDNGGGSDPQPPQNLVLTGDGGANTLTGNSGNDRLSGRGGNDTLTGNSGQDTILGEAGNDIINGGGEADLINGQNGQDQIWGGTGNDTINGGNGADLINGQNGNDTLWGGGGRDSINGGDGADLIGGGDGNDRISGGNNSDTVWAGAGNDIVYGDGGNDDLAGGSGRDVLNGGSGNDILRGGADADTLVFSTGNDRAIGFGANDVIDLSGVTTIANFNDLQANHLSGGSNAVIDDGLGNTLTIVGVGFGALDAGDFIF